MQTRWQYQNKNTKWSDEKRLKLLWDASRDSVRTPVQWSGAKNAGFTTGSKPWFYVNDNYKEINVERQEQDENSLLNFYRKARLVLQNVETPIFNLLKPYECRVYLWE